MDMNFLRFAKDDIYDDRCVYNIYKILWRNIEHLIVHKL